MSQESKTSRKRPRRSFTDDFKRDAVNLAAVEGYSFNRAAQAVGVSSNSLRRWYQNFVPEPEACGEDATVVSRDALCLVENQTVIRLS